MKKKLILFPVLFTCFFSIYSHNDQNDEAQAPESCFSKDTTSLLIFLGEKYLTTKDKKGNDNLNGLSYLAELLNQTNDHVAKKLKKTQQKIKTHSAYSQELDQNYQELSRALDKETEKVQGKIKDSAANSVQFNIQNQYLASIQNRKAEEKELYEDDKKEILEKQKLNFQEMIYLLDVFYLKSKTEQEFKKNKDLYILLAKIYHPDKIDKALSDEGTSFLQQINPILGANAHNEHLNKLSKTLNEQLHKKCKKLYGTQHSPFILIPYAISTRSLSSVAYKATGRTVLKLFSNKENENKCRKELSYLFRKSALKAESELININSQLPVHLRTPSIT